MHIIIIRPGAIGDTLLTLPAIEKLRKHYEDPQHPLYPERPHITFVGNAAMLPLLLASGLVDETHDFDETRWSALFALNGIRNPALRDMLRKADRVICWLSDPEGIVLRNLRETGVHRIAIGPGRPPEGKRFYAPSYLAQLVGARFFEDERFTLRLNFPDKEPARRYSIAIHPGSGSAQKCWPPASFAEVITHLWRNDISITLLSGPADAQRLQEVLHHLPADIQDSYQGIHEGHPYYKRAVQTTDDPVYGRGTPREYPGPRRFPGHRPPGDLTILDNLPLLEVARHLLLCRRYLGNDSGITHLAAMLGIPTVALFGSSDPAVWRPVGRYVEVIHDPDLAHLSVHSVIEKVL